MGNQEFEKFMKLTASLCHLILLQLNYYINFILLHNNIYYLIYIKYLISSQTSFLNERLYSEMGHSKSLKRRRARLTEKCNEIHDKQCSEKMKKNEKKTIDALIKNA